MRHKNPAAVFRGLGRTEACGEKSGGTGSILRFFPPDSAGGRSSSVHAPSCTSRMRAALWLSILLWGFVLATGACSRGDDAGSPKRLVVALPQWFYPSEERPWLAHAWQSIREADPDVAFDLQLTPGRTEQILQKLLVARASREMPDLACVKMHWVGDLLQRGMLQPIRQPAPGKQLEEMIPAIRATAEESGRIHVAPYDIGVRMILYRADLFAGAGIPEPQGSWTRDELLQAAQRLTADTDGDGTIDQWGLGVPGGRSEKTIFQWLPWFWSLGGRLCETGAEPVTILSPAAVQAMRWYQELAGRYRVTPPSFYSMDQEAVFEGLAGGMFAMTVGGSWEPALLKEHSRFGDRIKLALFPDPQPGIQGTSLVDGWGFVVLCQDSWKEQVIGRVLAQLTGPGHQMEKYRGSRSLSPYRTFYEDSRFLAEEGGEVLAEAVKRGRPLPECAGFPRVVEALEAALQEVLTRGTAPEEALAAQQKVLAQAEARRGPEGPGVEDKANAGRGREKDALRSGAALEVPQVPSGSLRVEIRGAWQDLVGQDELRALERKQVGDLALVPLETLSHLPARGRSGDGEAGKREISIRASDGFEKKVPAGDAPSAYLDPESMRVLLVREGGKVFTIRDVVEVVFLPGLESGALQATARGQSLTWNEQELKSMAADGAVSFRQLLAAKGVEAQGREPIRLVAADGYQREVPAELLLGGRLHIEGMRCEIPGASSKDQVSDLVRIEVR